MWTKRQLVNEAYSELALQGYEFDTSPEEVQTALRRLDTMMATWEGKGIQVGYAFPASPDDSNPDTPSGLPDGAVEAVYLNLAIRLAPGNGKPIGMDTKKSAADGYATLLRAAAMPPQQPLPNTMPRGAGNKPWRTLTSPFYPRPCTDPLPVDCAGDMNIPQEDA